MELASLFVNLGVKGSDQTLGAITGMRKGLKDTASVSLEAKAAIIGAMYALERLFASSGKAGTGLTNFTALTGVSAQALQRYQYAARQMGVSNEELEGSFKALQEQMTKTMLGQGYPAGFGEVAKVTGNISPEDVKKFAQDPTLLMQRLQEYAQKETDKGKRNIQLKTFGLSDGMIAAMDRNAFTPGALAKAPTYSDGEIKALDQANIAWSNLGTKIEMAVGHFNALHGGQLVKDISAITDKVIKLAEQMVKLADKAELFKWLGKVFEGWQAIFEGITAAIEFINAQKAPDEGPAQDSPAAAVAPLAGASAFAKQGAVDNAARQAEAKKEFANFMSGAMEMLAGFYGKHVLGVGGGTGSVGKTGENLFAPPGSVPGAVNVEPPHAKVIDFLKKGSVPKMPPVPPRSDKPATNVNVNQTLNFQHDGKDAAKTGDSVRAAAQRSFRSSFAQGQGS